jgi:hypothetical protein
MVHECHGEYGVRVGFDQRVGIYVQLNHNAMPTLTNPVSSI